MTPIAMFEVITDRDGRPISAVEVVSSSDVVIQSKDETIAKFSAAGPASEFAVPLIPAIIATPMIDPAGACLTLVDGTPIVQFKYSSSNEAEIEARVPITDLDPDLYRTSSTVEDDLLLHSIRNGDTPLIPNMSYRAPAPDDSKQVFGSGEGSFNIPYDIASGPLKWSFIGAETVVDSSTNLCEDPGLISCEPLSPALINQLVTEIRGTVTNTLKAAAKVMRLGKSPYLRTTARAIRRIKAQAEALKGALVCPEGAALPDSCTAEKFPAEDLIKTHSVIFSQPSPVKPKVFEKLQRTYTNRYRRFILRAFPRDIVRCPK